MPRPDASSATVFMVEAPATLSGNGLGIPESAVVPLVKALRGAGALEAAVLTSNDRTECYVVAATAEEARLVVAGALGRLLGADAGGIAPSLVIQQGQAAARHLFRLACGLESLVLGDGQLRQAYDAAHAAHAAGPLVRRVFHAAMAARVRASAIAAGLRSPAREDTTADGESEIEAAIEAEIASLDEWRVRRDAFAMLLA